MNNADYITRLEYFINSKRPEWLYRRATDMTLDQMPLENRKKAAERRTQASKLILSIAGDPRPDAWAILSKSTPFDSPEGAVCRGEIKPGEEDSRVQWLLDATIERGFMLNWSGDPAEDERAWSRGEDLGEFYAAEDRKRDALRSAGAGKRLRL